MSKRKPSYVSDSAKEGTLPEVLPEARNNVGKSSYRKGGCGAGAEVSETGGAIPGESGVSPRLSARTLEGLRRLGAEILAAKKAAAEAAPAASPTLAGLRLGPDALVRREGDRPGCSAAQAEVVGETDVVPLVPEGWRALYGIPGRVGYGRDGGQVEGAGTWCASTPEGRRVWCAEDREGPGQWPEAALFAACEAVDAARAFVGWAGASWLLVASVDAPRVIWLEHPEAGIHVRSSGDSWRVWRGGLRTEARYKSWRTAVTGVAVGAALERWREESPSAWSWCDVAGTERARVYRCGPYGAGEWCAKVDGKRLENARGMVRLWTHSGAARVAALEVLAPTGALSFTLTGGAS